MNESCISYLQEMKSEPEFIGRFIQSAAVRPNLLEQFGLAQRSCWIGINLDTIHLFPDHQGKPGEIDVIMGPMSARQPLVVDLIAFECKWFNFRTEPFEAGNLPHKTSGLEQARGLVDMGFDHVYLTYFICKPPGEGVNLGAWIAGADMQNALKRILRHPSERGKSLEEVINSEHFGFIVCEWGQVNGKAPEYAGSLSMQIYKESVRFAIDKVLIKRRRILTKLIKNAFNNFKGRFYSPLLLKQCENKFCKTLFFSDCLPRGKTIPKLCDNCHDSRI